MKLNDLNNRQVAVKALKENFSMDFDIGHLDKPKTFAMLKKVSGLLKESRMSKDFHKSELNPTYLKLLFMEQALTAHMKVAKMPRVIVENEEVDKSEVILAAQDMVDVVQKMYEDVNDMLVKELPALVDSIESEIGVNESSQFDETVTQSLTNLNSALQEAHSTLKKALGGLTGQGGMDAFSGEDDMGGEEDLDIDMDDGMGDEMDLDMDMGSDEEDVDLPPIPDIDDEEDITGTVGRARR